MSEKRNDGLFGVWIMISALASFTFGFWQDSFAAGLFIFFVAWYVPITVSMVQED
jgi:hypothetical protein